MLKNLLNYFKKSNSTAEATGELIGNKIADKIIRISKSVQHNDLETTTNEHDEEIPK